MLKLEKFYNNISKPGEKFKDHKEKFYIKFSNLDRCLKTLLILLFILVETLEHSTRAGSILSNSSSLTGAPSSRSDASSKLRVE